MLGVHLMTGDDFIQRDLAAHPLPISPGYKTSMFRGPTRPPLSLKTSMADLTGPVFGAEELGARDNDLILNYAKEGLPIGERIIIHGRVLDGNARPLRGVWWRFGRRMPRENIATAMMAISARLIQISAVAVAA